MLTHVSFFEGPSDGIDRASWSTHTEQGRGQIDRVIEHGPPHYWTFNGEGPWRLLDNPFRERFSTQSFHHKSIRLPMCMIKT